MSADRVRSFYADRFPETRRPVADSESVARRERIRNAEIQRVVMDALGRQDFDLVDVALTVAPKAGAFAASATAGDCAASILRSLAASLTAAADLIDDDAAACVARV
jgi:hypothetical protein